jgi:pimeloyl-ACP methyl ester carboxylesterase
LLVEGRKGDAVGLFMMYVGMPEEQLAGMHQHPLWPLWEAIGHTLAYDHTAILGEEASVPVERAARVNVPTLLITGGASFPFMAETARTLVEAMPHAEHRTLEGQTHDVAADALAPVLVKFFRT